MKKIEDNEKKRKNIKKDSFYTQKIHKEEPF